MKKRCTASNCRRVFNREKMVCPYCGKDYSNRGNGWEVLAIGDKYGASLLGAIKIYRMLMGGSLREAKDALTKVTAQGTARKFPASYGIYSSREMAQLVANQLEETRFVVKIERRSVQRGKAPTAVSQDAIDHFIMKTTQDARWR